MSTQPNLPGLSELLAKLGYSRYALTSEVVTEEMLDEMFVESRKTDENGNPSVTETYRADGHGIHHFSKSPTLISS